MGRRLFVGNLSFETEDADLKELFATSGTCESASVMKDRLTGRSRGFGFVEMASEDEARKAVTELDGRELRGRNIRVSEARERSAGGPPRSFGGPPRSFNQAPSFDGPPRFPKNRGSRRGLRGRKRSL
ncbi:MAG: RNA recognition motif domain-containing protein [Candidatus Polarisedimenticolia bacterium]